METFIILLLFLTCLVLITIEVFLIPGTSIAGIASACCLVAANILTFSLYGTTVGLWVLTASLLACILLGYWIMHSRTLDKYSLHKSIDSTSASHEQLSVRPGDEGIAVTRLALIGNAEIQGKLVEVKSADGFLDEGTHVIVTQVQEAQVIVKRK